MNPTVTLCPGEASSIWDAHPWNNEAEFPPLPPQRIEHIHDALLTPSVFLAPRHARGGVYDSAGNLLSDSRHLRRQMDFTEANPPRISPPPGTAKLKGRHLYLGWFFNHYGHFIMESLARCWPLLQNEPFDGYLFHLHDRAAQPSARLLEFFTLLEIPKDKIHFVTEPLVVEELHLPTQQAILGAGMALVMVQLYRHLGRLAWKKSGCPATPDKLYLSRRLLPPAQRRALNEASLERRFIERGYQVLHPQLLDLTRQLSLFYHATHFAGLEGTGLHNLLFSRNPEKVWLLTTDDRLADTITHAQLNHALGCRTELVIQPARAVTTLKRELTPFLLQPELLAGCGLSGVRIDPFSRYAWLDSLALQIVRQQQQPDSCSRELELSADEALVLDYRVQVHRDDTPAADEGQGSGVLHRLLRADLLLSAGRAGDAATELAACLEPCADNPDFLRHYTQALLAGGRLKEAQATVAQAEALDPGNPAIDLLNATLLFNSGNPGGAIDQLRESLARHPFHLPSLNRLAELLAQTDRYAEAATVLQDAIQRFPWNRNFHPRLTWYLIQSGELTQAETAALKALELLPDNPFSSAHLAQIYLRMGTPDKALHYATLAIERRPGDPAPYRLRAQIHEQLGSRSAMRQDLEQANALAGE